MEMSKEPCPFRILEDTGAAFAMGLIGGAGFQFVKGFRNAPTGLRRRFAGGMANMTAHAPKVGGSFAAWGGMFSLFECALVHYRGKEDPWNSIVSGAASGGILAARNGMAAMAGSALIGGMLLGMIEGVNIMMTRMSADQFQYPDPNVSLELSDKKG